MATTKKSKMGKRAKKRSAVKDLSAKSASAVKGGVPSAPTENITFNFSKVKVDYTNQ
jgi:type VI protein secretion system component Hcp